MSWEAAVQSTPPQEPKLLLTEQAAVAVKAWMPVVFVEEMAWWLTSLEPAAMALWMLVGFAVLSLMLWTSSEFVLVTAPQASLCWTSAYSAQLYQVRSIVMCDVSSGPVCSLCLVPAQTALVMLHMKDTLFMVRVHPD